MLKRFWCWLVYGHEGWPDGSIMTHDGPRYRYWCSRCKCYYSEPWE